MTVASNYIREVEHLAERIICQTCRPGIRGPTAIHLTLINHKYNFRVDTDLSCHNKQRSEK